MKKYIKPDTELMDINLPSYLQGVGDTTIDNADHTKGTDEWFPEEEIDDDEWW